MHHTIAPQARQNLARWLRRLASGHVTNREFERAWPWRGEEHALHSIYRHGIWPLYDDLYTHRLTGRHALDKARRRVVARMVLFLQSQVPYRYRETSAPTALLVLLLSIATLGRFGRRWQQRQWQDGDSAIWPFYTHSEYTAALRSPVFLAPRPGTSPAT